MVRVFCKYNLEWYENILKATLLGSHNSRKSIIRKPDGRLIISNEVQQNLQYHVLTWVTGRAGTAVIRNFEHEN